MTEEDWLVDGNPIAHLQIENVGRGAQTRPCYVQWKGTSSRRRQAHRGDPQALPVSAHVQTTTTDTEQRDGRHDQDKLVIGFTSRMDESFRSAQMLLASERTP